MNRNSYIVRQTAIRKKMEKLYVPAMEKALRQQIDVAVKTVATKGILAAQGHFEGDIVNTGVAHVTMQIYGSAAKAAMKGFKVETKDGFSDFIKGVLKYFTENLLNKVVLPISQTTIKQVDKILNDALNYGWGTEKTIAELNSPELTHYRARMIVRTETVRATNFTQMQAAKESDYETEKMWIAVDDNRTRRSHGHNGVDGQRVDLDQKFTNGLQFPGDPDGSASEVINCRCTMGYFAKRDLEGNIIFKKD